MVITLVILIFLGLALGSFVNALVWRLHEQEKLHEEVGKPNKKQLAELSIVHGRSMCPHCHHQLATRDLIPVLSWLMLRGKCRYCSKPISWQYPAVELLTMLLFVVSYLYWPMSFHGAGLLEFVLWLVFLVGFMALAVYDLKWFLLPNKIVYPLLVLAALQVLVVAAFYSGGWSLIFGSLWGVVIGGGIFYVLFQVSEGKWIGGGDVKLGALLGLLIGGPLMSCLLLFTASVCGTLVSLPLMISGKVKRDTQVPFGPFLLLAAVLVRLFGASFITWLRHRALLPPA